MARAIRWGSLAFIVLVAGAVYAASDMIKAYANQEFTWYQAEDMIAEEPPKLDEILMSLMGARELQGALVKVLQSAGLIAVQETNSYMACVDARSDAPDGKYPEPLCFAEASVEDLGMFYLDNDNNLPQQPGPNASEQEKMAYSRRLMEGTLMAAGQTIVDGAALIHRLRRGSDLLRGTVNDIGGVKALLSGIKEELHMMNGTDFHSRHG